MRVLLFSNDLMPFGSLPTSGGGLRCWQLLKGLEAHGIEVIPSMPGFTYLAEKFKDKIPKEVRQWLWKHETQDDVLREVKPDAVLYASNWDHYSLSKKPDIPVIVDLHGSRLIETTMWDRPVSTERKVSIFSKADCFLTAGTRQQNYFYGWLLQAGRVPGDKHLIHYIPVSLSPDCPEHPGLDSQDDEFPMFVSGGGWFPWQNQSTAIYTVCDEIAKRDAGKVQIFGTPHAQNASSADEQRIMDVYKRVSALSQNSSRIDVCGYVGREELLGIYSRATLAMEVMEYNLERELAFTTRTVEYLWCGLPVMYNNFGEIAVHISEYDAGWCLDPRDEKAISETIDEIFNDAETVKLKSKNAQRLVKERFSWDKTIQPLVDFLKAPQVLSESDPVMGLVYTRPSFLQAKGETKDIILTEQCLEIKQSIIVPAENICGVEVPVFLPASKCRDIIDSVSLTLSSKGRQIARKTFRKEQIPVTGVLSVILPFWRAPVGGEELELCFKVKLLSSFKANSKKPTEILGLRALTEVKFPFLPLSSDCNTALNIKALALSFMPAEYSMAYKLKLMARRGMEMIRQGQWRRLYRAVLRRLPRLMSKLGLAS